MLASTFSHSILQLVELLLVEECWHFGLEDWQSTIDAGLVICFLLLLKEDDFGVLVELF